MPADAQRHEEPESHAGGRVLVVDDDPILLDLLTKAFRADGFVTRCADNGRQALALLQAEAFDLVVTDIVMPDSEGIGTILQIKRKPRPPKVIAISGAGRGGRGDYLTWARHLGADEVLAKPFRMAQLIDLSRRLISNQSDSVMEMGSR
ncbi:response regulator [Phenylobacterium sp.]|uniref:response regulator n=1 Tax=Phenylobacterium sp. TaxID=1871053 RepID=UPI00286A1E75|nr:response regulator [Phenylobacterium sp.]